MGIQQKLQRGEVGEWVHCRSLSLDSLSNQATTQRLQQDNFFKNRVINEWNCQC